MKKFLGIGMFIMSCCFVMSFSLAKAAGAEKSGEQLFKDYCAMCHVDGGNIVNPQKTLHKKDRDAHGVKTVEDIVKIMRKPGTGMTIFNEKTIPDKDAKKIAEYILTTFK